MNTNIRRKDVLYFYFDIFKDIKGRHKDFGSWYAVIKMLLFKAGILKEVTLPNIKNKTKVRIKSKEEYLNFWHSWHQDSTTISDQIKYDTQYDWLDIKDSDVVDIGANIGDSAIYFVNRGARRVYSFEPFPYSYEKAKKNVVNYGAGEKVILFNKAYGKPSFVMIPESFKNTEGSSLRDFNNGKRIKVISLKEIIEELKIGDAKLKCDCEGGEYNILHEDNGTLQHFSQIQIEYHYVFLHIYIQSTYLDFQHLC